MYFLSSKTEIVHSAKTPNKTRYGDEYGKCLNALWSLSNGSMTQNNKKCFLKLMNKF